MSQIETENQAKRMCTILSQIATKNLMKDQLLFTKALNYWFDKKRLKARELADLLGTVPNTISQYKTGVRTPPMEKLEGLVDALGISLPEFFACNDGSLPDIEFVERVKATPRAGGGGLETDGECVGLYSFHTSFIRRKGASAATDMKIFKIDGDSMEPTLQSGDLIMINTKVKDIQSGHIYLMRLEDELMVKRLERRPGGILLIRSDNKDYYDPMEISLSDEHVDFEVFGRMVWACREY